MTHPLLVIAGVLWVGSGVALYLAQRKVCRLSGTWTMAARTGAIIVSAFGLLAAWVIAVVVVFRILLAVVHSKDWDAPAKW